MLIELDLDMRTIRMIKALSALTGKPSGEVSSVVSELIQEGLKSKIAHELGLDDMGFTPKEPVATKPTTKKGVDFADITGISDGLGDDDVEVTESSSPPALKKADALVPSTGGVKDEDLDKDMDLDDPEHESKAEATFADTYFKNKNTKPEDMFSDMAGLPKAAASEDDAPPQRAPKRRVNPNAKRARVTPLTHEPRDA